MFKYVSFKINVWNLNQSVALFDSVRLAVWIRGVESRVRSTDEWYNFKCDENVMLSGVFVLKMSRISGRFREKFGQFARFGEDWILYRSIDIKHRRLFPQ